MIRMFKRFSLKEYVPIKDNMYYDRMSVRVMKEPSFKLCFKRNISDRFFKDLEGLYAKDRLFRTNTIIQVSGETGCQPKGSKVLMANGEWKNIEEIKIGDEVISPQHNGTNKFSKVINIIDWFCEENYNVVELNGKKRHFYSCSYNHLIPTYHKYFPRIKGKRDNNRKKRVIKNYESKYFSQMSNNAKSHNNIGISSFLIKKFKYKKNCEIEPYTLGAYLGDGHSRNELKKIGRWDCWGRQLAVTTSYKEIINEIKKHYKIMSVGVKKGTEAKTYRFSVKSKLFQQLKKYNLIGKKSGNKFIPKEALLSDSNYRKKLLAGLLDTDGTISKKGGIEYCSKSRKLLENIRFLIYSLGGRCKIRKTIGKIKSIGFKGIYYEMSIYLHDMKLPQKLKRKISNSNRVYLSSNRVAINSIKNNKKEQVYGFTLNSLSGLYITDNFMVTHNSGKSIGVISLAKKICPNFNQLTNVKFYDQELLDEFKNNPKDTMLIRDEQVAKGVFGMGSTRIENQLSVVGDTARKNGLSLIFVEPEFRRNDIAKWYLETIDIGSVTKNGKTYRVNRIGVKEPHTETFLGCILLEVLSEEDPDWVAYNERKDKFIKEVLDADFSGAKMDFEQVAIDILQDMDTEIYKNLKEKKLFILKKYPSYTNQEVDMILTAVKILEKQGSL